MQTSPTRKLVINALAFSLIISTLLAANPVRASASGPSMLRADGSAPLKQQGASQQRTRNSRLPIIGEAAELIGMKPDQLAVELAGQASIADIAVRNGITEQVLTDKLLALRTETLDRALADARLTRETVETIKARMARHIGYMLRQSGAVLLERGGGQAVAAHPLNQFTPDKIAGLIGIPKEMLVSRLQAGNTLQQIAEEQQISKEQLLNKIKVDL